MIEKKFQFERVVPKISMFYKKQTLNLYDISIDNANKQINK